MQFYSKLSLFPLFLTHPPSLPYPLFSPSLAGISLASIAISAAIIVPVAIIILYIVYKVKYKKEAGQ